MLFEFIKEAEVSFLFLCPEKGFKLVSESLPMPGLFKSDVPGDDGGEGVGCHIFAAPTFDAVVPV